MSIQRWDPFRDMLSLRDAMDRLFQESVVRPSTAPMGVGAAAYGLALDLEESDDAYTIKASLPGFKPEDVNVSVVGDTLTIQAQQSGEEERQGSNYLLRERRLGSLSRTVTLPQRVQADQAEARYEHGELVLTLPKAEDLKPKQIKIDVQGRQELSGGTAPRTEATGAVARESEGSQPATPEMARGGEEQQVQQ
jgi:HSP20 family protein